MDPSDFNQGPFKLPEAVLKERLSGVIEWAIQEYPSLTWMEIWIELQTLSLEACEQATMSYFEQFEVDDEDDEDDD